MWQRTGLLHFLRNPVHECMYSPVRSKKVFEFDPLAPAHGHGLRFLGQFEHYAIPLACGHSKLEGRSLHLNLFVPRTDRGDP